MCEVKSEEGVANVEASKENSHVCLCARVRLYICPASAEDLFQSFDSEGFALVNNFATTIVTLSRITFSILVCHYRTHSFHYLVANKVFRCDELDALHLSFSFLLYKVENLFISNHDILF